MLKNDLLQLSGSVGRCLHLGSPEKQNRMYTFYYKELHYVITEAKKSQDQQLASWRPRNASGIVSVRVPRPEKNQDS